MNNINKIVVINKPQSWTSHDCVAVMRRVTGIKRIGHTGTLDPMATGVLPICIGTATRIMEYLDLDYKTYKCTMKLGIITDTQDIWGEVLKTSDNWKNINLEDVKKVFAKFKGEISQIPPKYSALKVNGKKLYEYARKGQDVEIKPRKIYIDDITIDNFVNDEISFSVRCSKGTYVRTICSDIGDMLGCGASMSSLVRTQTGIFSLEDALNIEEVKNMNINDIMEKSFDTDYPLVYFGKIVLPEKFGKDLVNGKTIYLKNKYFIEKESKHEEMYNVYCNGEFIAVARINENKLKSDKVFNVRMQNENI